MGANTNGDKNFGFDRTRLVQGVCGGQFARLALRLGVSQLGLDFFQGLDLVRRALDDPNRLTAPLDGHFFTRGQGGNVYLDSGTGSFGFFRRLECTNKGDCDGYAAHSTCAGGGDQPRAFAAINWGVTHEIPRALCHKWG